MIMKNKKISIFIAISILVVIVFTMLSSYAYWRIRRGQTGRNQLIGACLSIELEEYDDEAENIINGFTLDDAWPITDQEGFILK